jgi:aspartyl-tRNA(Asn)/glutamyl-tRNA(Gln) amidotransferase subunit C
MALTIDEVRHVALLARIGLNEQQLKKYHTQLNEAFKGIDVLQELDIEGIEPTIHPNQAVNVMRDDEYRLVLGIKKALLNAPQHEGSAFLVPRIVAPGGGSDE